MNVKALTHPFSGRAVSRRLIHSASISFVMGMGMMIAQAQVQITVPGDASGHFGNPSDQVVPLVPAITVDGPATIKISYLSGTVTDSTGISVGPGGYTVTTPLGTQTPLQEGQGVSGGKIRDLNALIGAFVCKWEGATPGFKPVDGTKAAVAAGLLPDKLFYVGESLTYQAKEAGTLYLGINNWKVSGNSGGYQVQVSVPSASYDATAEFSGSQNPSGVWSYGWTATRGGSLNLFSLLGPDVWSWTGPPGPPSLAYNSKSTSLSYETVTVPPMTLYFHPGPQNQNSVIRFTAPAAGTYSIQVSVWGDDWAGPTTTNTALLHNGTSLHEFQLDGFGTSSQQNYSTTVTTQAGDTIDLSVGVGPDNVYFYDTTGFSLVIAQE